MTWLPLYKRYTSECPTVDRVWMDYVKMLLEVGEIDCTGVVDMGVKNVPWSGALHSLRISLQGGGAVGEDGREAALKSVKKVRSCELRRTSHKLQKIVRLIRLFTPPLLVVGARKEPVQLLLGLPREGRRVGQRLLGGGALASECQGVTAGRRQ